MGFSEGFGSGAKAVNSIFDRNLKRETLEEEAAYKQRTADDLAAYRTEDLNIKMLGQESDASLKKMQVVNAGLAGETALIKAETARTKAENLADPTSIESLKIQSEIDENEAQTKKYIAEGDRVTGEEKRFKAALNYDAVFKYAEQADGIYDSKMLDDIERMYQQNKGTGIFNFGTSLSNVNRRGQQEIGAFLADMAGGYNPEMSDSVLRAATTVLQLDASAAVGRSIDSSFVNAPQGYHDKGYKIASQGLFQASATGAKADLTGKLVVEIVNENDPNDVQFYFPPLSEGRSYIKSAPVTINMGDFSSAAAGNAYLVQQSYDVMKPAVKEARIKAKYGDNRGDNGKAKFDAEVTAILDKNIDAIKTGGNTGTMYGGSPELLELSREQMLDDVEVAKIKSGIEERLLFGSREEPMQTRAKKWLVETKSALLSAPAPEGGVKLNELISEEQWSPQLISGLAPYYDVDDKGEAFIKNEEALKQFLINKGYNNK